MHCELLDVVDNFLDMPLDQTVLEHEFKCVFLCLFVCVPLVLVAKKNTVTSLTNKWKMCHSFKTANVFRITYGRMIRCYVWSRAVFNWLHGSVVAVNDILKKTIWNLFSHCREMSTSWKSRIFLFYIDFLSAVVLNPPCVPQNTIKIFFSSIGKSARVKRLG